jgi:hypothetical protein
MGNQSSKGEKMNFSNILLYLAVGCIAIEIVVKIYNKWIKRK